MKRKSTLVVFLFTISSFYTVGQFKLEEDFSSPTFPPAGWTRGANFSDGVFAALQHEWERRTASAYDIGEGSAQVFFYDISFEPVDSLTSPVFTATIPNDSLYFDHAYRTTTPFSAVDELRIYTSDNGGADFILFQTLLGGDGGELNTESPDNADYENPAVWASKKYALPTGINKIKFESFSANGNNLFLDNIKVGKALVVVPVTFLNFSGNKNDSEVQLSWALSNEINNAEFDIEKLLGSSWQKIGTVKSKGNSGTRADYAFNDIFPENGYNYYRIKQIDIDGKVWYSNVISIEFTINKNGYGFQNFPNPFTINTSIYYQVPEKLPVQLIIFDVQGKHIKTLVNEIKDKGSYQAIWHVNYTSPGIYFCQAIIGKKAYTIKLNKVN